MKGTVYFKKWTRMPWWSRLHHLEALSLTEFKANSIDNPTRLIDICDRLFKEYDKRERSQRYEPVSREKAERMPESNRLYFVNRLYEEFPEIKAIEMTRSLQEINHPENSTLKLIKQLVGQYLRLLNNGLGKEAACEQIFTKIKQRYSIEQDNLLDLVASSNSEPLMPALLKEKKREAELKTKQITRRSELNEKIKDGILDDLHEYIPSYVIVDEKNVKAKNEENPFDYNFFENEKNKKEEFLNRGKGLLDRYYNSVLTRDRLSTISGQEIEERVINSPTAIRKLLIPIVKLCEKAEVSLDSKGNVCWPATSTGIVTKLRRQEQMVKLALMSKDLDFGFEHSNKIRKRARILNEQLLGLSKEVRREVENKENLRLSELLLQKGLDSEDIDALTNTEKTGRSVKDLEQGVKGLLEGSKKRADFEFSLRDTPIERLLKTETKWLIERTRNPSTPEVEANTLASKVVNAVRKLRQLKLKLDNESLKNTGRLIWSEHSDFNFDIEEVDFQQLEDYLEVEEEDFMRVPNLDSERRKVKSILEPSKLPTSIKHPLSSEAIEDNQSSEKFWQDEQLRQIKLQSTVTDNNGVPVNLNSQKLFRLTPNQIKNYRKDNPEADPTKDVVLRYLEQRYGKQTKKSALKGPPSKKK